VPEVIYEKKGKRSDGVETEGQVLQEGNTIYVEVSASGKVFLRQNNPPGKKGKPFTKTTAKKFLDGFIERLEKTKPPEPEELLWRTRK